MGKRPLPVEKQARAASRRAAREAQRDYQTLAATSRRIFAELDRLPEQAPRRARALLDAGDVERKTVVGGVGAYPATGGNGNGRTPPA